MSAFHSELFVFRLLVQTEVVCSHLYCKLCVCKNVMACCLTISHGFLSRGEEGFDITLYSDSALCVSRALQGHLCWPNMTNKRWYLWQSSHKETTTPLTKTVNPVSPPARVSQTRMSCGVHITSLTPGSKLWFSLPLFLLFSPSHFLFSLLLSRITLSVGCKVTTVCSACVCLSHRWHISASCSHLYHQPVPVPKIWAYLNMIYSQTQSIIFCPITKLLLCQTWWFDAEIDPPIRSVTWVKKRLLVRRTGL